MRIAYSAEITKYLCTVELFAGQKYQASWPILSYLRQFCCYFVKHSSGLTDVTAKVYFDVEIEGHPDEGGRIIMGLFGKAGM